MAPPLTSSTSAWEAFFLSSCERPTPGTALWFRRLREEPERFLEEVPQGIANFIETCHPVLSFEDVLGSWCWALSDGGVRRGDLSPADMEGIEIVRVAAPTVRLGNYWRHDGIIQLCEEGQRLYFLHAYLTWCQLEFLPAVRRRLPLSPLERREQTRKSEEFRDDPEGVRDRSDEGEMDWRERDRVLADNMVTISRAHHPDSSREREPFATYTAHFRRSDPVFTPPNGEFASQAAAQEPEAPTAELLRRRRLSWLGSVLKNPKTAPARVRGQVMKTVGHDCPVLSVSDVLGGWAWALAGGVVELQMPEGNLDKARTARSIEVGFELLLDACGDIVRNQGCLVVGPCLVSLNDLMAQFKRWHQIWTEHDLLPARARVRALLGPCGPDTEDEYVSMATAGEGALLDRDLSLVATKSLDASTLHMEHEWTEYPNAIRSAHFEAEGSSPLLSVELARESAKLVDIKGGQSVQRRRSDGKVVLAERRYRDAMMKLFKAPRTRARKADESDLPKQAVFVRLEGLQLATPSPYANILDQLANQDWSASERLIIQALDRWDFVRDLDTVLNGVSLIKPVLERLLSFASEESPGTHRAAYLFALGEALSKPKIWKQKFLAAKLSVKDREVRRLVPFYRDMWTDKFNKTPL